MLSASSIGSIRCSLPPSGAVAEQFAVPAPLTEQYGVAAERVRPADTAAGRLANAEDDAG